VIHSYRTSLFLSLAVGLVEPVGLCFIRDLLADA
jgi:hypothetical protein